MNNKYCLFSYIETQFVPFPIWTWTPVMEVTMEWKAFHFYQRITLSLWSLWRTLADHHPWQTQRLNYCYSGIEM